MSNTPINNTGVIILSAGISRRMHSPKQFLKFDKERTFLEKIIDEYNTFGCCEIVLVTNSEIDWKNNLSYKPSDKVTTVINNHLEHERYYSIKLGLSKISKSEFCFIQNIDNPFVTPNLLETLFQNRNKEGYVSPRYKGKGGHPILLGENIINDIKSVKEKDLNFRTILNNYKCLKVDTENPEILVNINTNEDYQKYFNIRG